LAGGAITVSIVQTNPTTLANTTTAIATITPTAAGGVIPATFTASNAVATILSNIGTLDVTLTFSAANVTALTGGAVGGVFQTTYTARNYTGSIINVGQGYTNS